MEDMWGGVVLKIWPNLRFLVLIMEVVLIKMRLMVFGKHFDVPCICFISPQEKFVKGKHFGADKQTKLLDNTVI